MCTQAGFPADEMNRASLAASDLIQLPISDETIVWHYAEFMYSLEERDGVLDVTVFHGASCSPLSCLAAHEFLH
jgi:hypothetical protein